VRNTSVHKRRSTGSDAGTNRINSGPRFNQKALLSRSIVVGIILFALAASVMGSAEPPKLHITQPGEIPAPFAVDEKGLRKLNEILEKRISEICLDYDLLYNVTFAENSTYETDSFELILQEENKPPRTINRISMQAMSPWHCENPSNPASTRSSIQIDFKKDSFSSGIFSTIKGNKRDWVFVTHSDISDKLSSFKNAYLIPKSAWQFVFALAAGALFGAAFLGRRGYSKKLKAADLTFTSMTLKQYIFRTDPHLPSLLFMASFMIAFFCFIVSFQLMGYIFPAAVFLIGDEIGRNEQISNLRSTIVSVVVGLILIPILVNLFTSRIFKTP
jgi:hypothetical protein